MDREFEAEIKSAVGKKGFVKLSNHALEEAHKDSITTNNIVDSILSGRMIEDYPAVTRGHDCLFCGWSEGKPIHCVVTIINDNVFIITTYIPDIDEWTEDYTTRRGEV